MSAESARNYPQCLIQCIGDTAWLHLFKLSEEFDDSPRKLLAPYRRVRKSKSLATPGGAWLQSQLVRAAVGDTCRIPLFLPFSLADNVVRFSRPKHSPTQTASMTPMDLNVGISLQCFDTEDGDMESFDDEGDSKQYYTSELPVSSIEISSIQTNNGEEKIQATFTVQQSDWDRFRNFVSSLTIGTSFFRLGFFIEGSLDPNSGTMASVTPKKDASPKRTPHDVSMTPSKRSFVWFRTPLWTLLPSTILSCDGSTSLVDITNFFQHQNSHIEAPPRRTRGNFQAHFLSDAAVGISDIDKAVFSEFTSEHALSELRSTLENSLADAGFLRDFHPTFKILDGETETLFGFEDEDLTRANLNGNDSRLIGSEFILMGMSPLVVEWNEESRPWLTNLAFRDSHEELALKLSNQESYNAHVRTYSLSDASPHLDREAWWEVKTPDNVVTRMHQVLGDECNSLQDSNEKALEPLPIDTSISADGDEYAPIRHLIITDIDGGFREPVASRDSFAKYLHELPEKYTKCLSRWKEFSNDELEPALNSIRQFIQKLRPAVKDVLPKQLEASMAINGKSPLVSPWFSFMPRREWISEIEDLIVDSLQELTPITQRGRTRSTRKTNSSDASSLIERFNQLSELLSKARDLQDEFANLLINTKQIPTKWGSIIDWLEFNYGSRNQTQTEAANPGLILVNIGSTLPITELDDFSDGPNESWDRGGLWNVLLDLELSNLKDEQITLSRSVVVVVSAHLLRACGARIAHRLSWEHSTEDLWNALKNNPRLEPLLKFRYVVVRFGCAGAVLVDTENPQDPKLTVFYDPLAGNDFFRDADQSGRVLGSNSTLIASIMRKVIDHSNSADNYRSAICEGIKLGIRAVQTLYTKGYRAFQSPDRFVTSDAITLNTSGIELLNYSAPLELFSESERQETTKVSSIDVTTRAAGWRITDKFSQAALFDSALQFIMTRNGQKKRVLIQPSGDDLTIPVAQFGGFTAVERSEIESFRSIQGLLRRYQNSTEQNPKPLSIAVFGPPGSGKSFGVKAVAKTLGENSVSLDNFNLSQFSQEQDLVIPFLKVSKPSEGELPILFFDEFDSALADTPLGWLKYLLQPMQDGEFKFKDEIRKIGKCVFVFAGGTSPSFLEFTRETANETEKEEFRLAKGPDFVSRLSGYIDVLGVLKSQNDNGHILRRALVIRSLLESRGLVGENGNALVDRSFLSILLEVGSLKHGSRSIEKLLYMCVGDDGTLRLPAVAQLLLHLNEQEAQSLWRKIFASRA